MRLLKRGRKKMLTKSIQSVLLGAFERLNGDEQQRLIDFEAAGKTIFCGKGSAEKWEDELDNP